MRSARLQKQFFASSRGRRFQQDLFTSIFTIDALAYFQLPSSKRPKAPLRQPRLKVRAAVARSSEFFGFEAYHSVRHPLFPAGYPSARSGSAAEPESGISAS